MDLDGGGNSPQVFIKGLPIPVGREEEEEETRDLMMEFFKADCDEFLSGTDLEINFLRLIFTKKHPDKY